MNFKKYLPEFVYGAIDGTITTFAIVAGAIGANLSPAIILILGFANLFADGFSMAVSNYLSTKSQIEMLATHKHKHEDLKNPKKTALATFIAFVIVGFIPLLSFILALFLTFIDKNKFIYSAILTALAFLAIGSIKGKVTKKEKLNSAIETLAIGGLAALIAFFVGFLVKSLL